MSLTSMFILASLTDILVNETNAGHFFLFQKTSFYLTKQKDLLTDLLHTLKACVIWQMFIFIEVEVYSEMTRVKI